MTAKPEKCVICRNRLTAARAICDFCHYPVFREYLLDVGARSEYKGRLQYHRQNWEELNRFLGVSFNDHKERWSKNPNWEEIWRQIEPIARAVGFDEPGAVMLVDRLRKGSFTNDDRKVIPAPAKNDNSAGPEYVTRQKVSEWVAGLSEAEYDVRDWVLFTNALGDTAEVDGQPDIHNEAPLFEALTGLLKDEIRRQFFTFETFSVDSAGECFDRRQLTVRQFVEVLDDRTELVLVKILAGGFEMGNAGWSHTKPVHRVEVPDFWLGSAPVTLDQWQIVARMPRIDIDLDADPSYFHGQSLPVDSVSWLECAEFCKRLSVFTGRKYRLPSEAEWEYAARAASTASFSFGETIPPWISSYFFEGRDAAHAQTVASGNTLPNAFGLTHMHGNLWEWCADTWHKDYSGAPANSEPWVKGTDTARRVLRGGAWCNPVELCTSFERIAEPADENGKLNYIGFRIALDL